MLRTQDGSPDGVRVLSYVKGLEYPAAGFPLSGSLRAVFLREGWAEECGSPDPDITSAQKPAASVESEEAAALRRIHDAEDAKRAAVAPCPTTSPIGEPCTLIGQHAEHEWGPRPTKPRRGRRTGGV